MSNSIETLTFEERQELLRLERSDREHGSTIPSNPEDAFYFERSLLRAKAYRIACGVTLDDVIQ